MLLFEYWFQGGEEKESGRCWEKGLLEEGVAVPKAHRKQHQQYFAFLQTSISEHPHNYKDSEIENWEFVFSAGFVQSVSTRFFS